MTSLSKRIALVTGASSGIGATIARLFAAEGATVALAHHDTHAGAKDAKRIAGEITAAGGRVMPLALDVCDRRSVEQVFARARDVLGTPTILVNAAGIDAAGVPVGEMDPDQFEKVLRTNLIGPFLTCREFLRVRGDGGGAGRIVNITSVHEDIPRAGAADYCAAKGGLRNLTRCLALELAEKGVTVNNLAPGMVLTPMNQEAIDDPEKRKEQTASIPMKRAAAPEEVAKLALYLVSADAAYATGATFTLDGGLQMNLGQGA